MTHPSILDDWTVATAEMASKIAGAICEAAGALLLLRFVILLTRFEDEYFMIMCAFGGVVGSACVWYQAAKLMAGCIRVQRHTCVLMRLLKAGSATGVAAILTWYGLNEVYESGVFRFDYNLVVCITGAMTAISAAWFFTFALTAGWTVFGLGE